MGVAVADAGQEERLADKRDGASGLLLLLPRCCCCLFLLAAAVGETDAELLAAEGELGALSELFIPRLAGNDLKDKKI